MQPSRLPQRCFSNFVQRLVIQSDQNPANIVEWRKATASGLVDGFEFHRIGGQSYLYLCLEKEFERNLGDEKCKVKISLWLDHSPPRFKLDPALTKPFQLETGQASRSTILEE